MFYLFWLICIRSFLTSCAFPGCSQESRSSTAPLGFLVSIDDHFGTEVLVGDQDYDDHGYFDNYCDEDENDEMYPSHSARASVSLAPLPRLVVRQDSHLRTRRTSNLLFTSLQLPMLSSMLLKLTSALSSSSSLAGSHLCIITTSIFVPL